MPSLRLTVTVTVPVEGDPLTGHDYEGMLGGNVEFDMATDGLQDCIADILGKDDLLDIESLYEVEIVDA